MRRSAPRWALRRSCPQRALRPAHRGRLSSLTADDDELDRVSGISHCEQNMLKLRAFHSSDHKLEDATALGLAQQACQRRVLTQISGMLILCHHRRAQPRAGTFEEALPLIGVDRRDAARLSPALQGRPRISHFGGTQTTSECPVIRERTTCSTLVRFAVCRRALRVKPCGTISVAAHLGLEHMPAPACTSVVHLSLEPQQRVDRHLTLPVRPHDQGNIARCDPPGETGGADAEETSCRALREGRAKLITEQPLGDPEVRVVRSCASFAAPSRASEAQRLASSARILATSRRRSPVGPSRRARVR